MADNTRTTAGAAPIAPPTETLVAADLSAESGSDTDRNPLDLVAEEFAARCRRGEHPSVGDYVRQYPQWAERLREVLPPIALMERLKARNASRTGPGAGGASAQPPTPAIERLGDFHVLREVGRGGMGVVYEAEQESLGRRVALKVLARAAVLDPQHLRRFEREARAVAGLHHTNIVQVFGVGEQNGLHYFVMQFIRGRSLSQALTEIAGAGGGHPATLGVNRAGELVRGKPVRRAAGTARAGS